MPLRLEIVGRCSAFVGDERIGQSSELVIAGAIYLALESPGPVPRAALAEILWPQVEATKRTGRLRWLLSKLRRRGLAFDADEQEVQLRPGAVQTDAQNVAALPLSVLGPIMNGYSPNFSPAFSEWVDRKREVIAAQVIDQMRERLRRTIQSRDWTAVIALASAMRHVDPLDEATTIALADALHRTGAAARATNVLEEYLESIPHANAPLPIRTLLDRIRAGINDEQAESAFIGRDNELRRVEGVLDRAAKGRGGGLVLAGAAGIGKTRLLDQAVGRASLAGMQVVRIRCQPGDASTPLAGIMELASQLITLRGAAGADPSNLARLTSLVRTSGNSSQNSNGEPPQAGNRRLITLAFTDVLEAASSDAPVALVLDDIQWMDQASLGFIQKLLESSQNTQVAWLFACRVSETTDVPLNAPTVVVSALNSIESRTLLMRLAERLGLRLDEPNRAAILERGGGNPLFLGELLRHWAGNGSMHELPASLSMMLDTTLRGLSRVGLLCLQSTAILGRYATVDRIEALLQLEREQFLASIAELETAGILVVDADGSIGGHGLWSAAALDRLTPGLKRSMHRHAALHFDDELTRNPSAAWIWESVRHWDAAGYRERARSSALRGAEHLARNGLTAESAAVYRTLLDQEMSLEEQLPLRRRRIELLYLSNELSEVVHEIDRHERVASELDPSYDFHNRFELLRRAALHGGIVWPFATNMVSDLSGDSHMLLAGSLACVRDTRATTAHRLAAALQCSIMANSLAHDTVAETWSVASQITPTNHEEWRARQRTAMEYEILVGDVRKAVNLAEDYLIAERRRPPDRDLVIALGSCARTYQLVGRFADARRACLEGIDIAKKSGFVEPLIFMYDQMIGFASDFEKPVVVRRMLEDLRRILSNVDPAGKSLAARVSIPSFFAQLAVDEGRPHDAMKVAVPIDKAITCVPRRIRARLLAVHLAARLATGDMFRTDEIIAALASCFLEPDNWLDWPATIYAEYLQRFRSPGTAAAFAQNFITAIRRELYEPPARLAAIAAAEHHAQRLAESQLSSPFTSPVVVAPK